MTPTLCKCGGMIGRCECADIRREAFKEAADYHLRMVPLAYTTGERIGHESAEAHFRALAKPPEPL